MAGLDFMHAVGAFGMFVALDKRLDDWISVYFGFFVIEMINIVLDASDMVFVDEITELIERRWGL